MQETSLQGQQPGLVASLAIISHLTPVYIVAAGNLGANGHCPRIFEGGP